MVFRRMAAILAMAGLLAGAGASAQTAPSRVLRAVMDADLAITDPSFTSAYITRSFAYMAFDMLLAQDSNGQIRPQMLDRWETSEDGLTWTFYLRDGLVFSDGQPVTAEDCVASLQRWGQRDAFGRLLIERTAGFDVLDAKSFRLRLSRPFGFVLQALGKPSSFVPVIMPARLARQDPATAITEVVGSGPFLFKRDEWVPGSHAVFTRNPNYRPRPEPADGFAGGKVVHFDRVEFRTVPDAATAVAALQSGEVDYVQYAPLDLLPVLRRNANLRIDAARGVGGFLVTFRPNHKQPPFDNPAIRRVLQIALDQNDVLAAVGVPEADRRPCLSLYMCGSPLETTVGTEAFRTPNLERARTMLREAGYKGERIVLLHATDVQSIDLSASVVAEALRRVGFNVDDQAMDWPTLNGRRNRQEPLAQNGWSGFAAITSGYDMALPVTNFYVGYSCRSFPGWSCDERIPPLVDAFVSTTDETRQKELAAQMHAIAVENVSAVSGGQVPIPAAYRADLQGLLSVGFPLFWNVHR
jgi:peptide/nickel transport system substrate-binding protein